MFQARDFIENNSADLPPPPAETRPRGGVSGGVGEPISLHAVGKDQDGLTVAAGEQIDRSGAQRVAVREAEGLEPGGKLSEQEGLPETLDE